MDYLYICNTGSDSVSKVCLKDLKEIKINIKRQSELVGPHGICPWKSYVIVANNYNDTISILDITEDKEVANYYIGSHCNDLKVFKEYAYVLCGESNTLVIFDLISRKVIRELPCGNMPHSIDICKNSGVAAVANMEGHEISIIDCNKNEVIKTINLFESYPTKVIFSEDGENIIVCESNMGIDRNGRINILAINQGKSVATVETGRCPVDMSVDFRKNLGFVSNFSEGTISILDLNHMEEIKKVYVGGTPRGILQHKKFLYVGDNYNNVLIKYDIYKGNKNAITIDKEPNGMALV
ncbi:YncE family protein [Clostridium algidicarnis]|uniref:YncE family protein n=1 Tax=Clostridium algidicarnis TaxID=37659 RepID=UPI001C0AD6DC|nr:YncE family protein [Clostridium algidicarnis]MBU3208280.1 YncE family protein [Clostridium algidicarnis]MBU3227488.1 YncE family protein [Clostridium algidicarnis]MBU3251105.1 YncE family protein [Clostridium algidicarnis]